MAIKGALITHERLHEHANTLTRVAQMHSSQNFSLCFCPCKVSQLCVLRVAKKLRSDICLAI